LYGTAVTGAWGSGALFEVNTDGTGEVILHMFTSRSNQFPYTNSDGAAPCGGLVLSGNTLYGTAQVGGNGGGGTVFAVNTEGTNFRVLYNFSSTSGPFNGPYTNSDGARPQADLVLLGDTLYGTTAEGGISGSGTVFKINCDGTGFATLYSFTVLSPPFSGTNCDGAYPNAGMIMSGNTLYGSTSIGGLYGYGTVFRLTIVPEPQVSIIPFGPYMILTWPTNAFVFTLQSSTDIRSSAHWNTNSPAPVVIGGQNLIVSPISNTQMFFRLQLGP
jgi:uncharacterized repeat protein (TIGR03803 family)